LEKVSEPRMPFEFTVIAPLPLKGSSRAVVPTFGD
jgi:hypothetical protein